MFLAKNKLSNPKEKLTKKEQKLEPRWIRLKSMP